MTESTVNDTMPLFAAIAIFKMNGSKRSNRGETPTSSIQSPSGQRLNGVLEADDTTSPRETRFTSLRLPRAATNLQLKPSIRLLNKRTSSLGTTDMTSTILARFAQLATSASPEPTDRANTISEGNSFEENTMTNRRL